MPEVKGRVEELQMEKILSRFGAQKKITAKTKVPKKGSNVPIKDFWNDNRGSSGRRNTKRC